MKRKLKITANNADKLKRWLKEQGMSVQEVNALNYGCYLYDGEKLYKISESDYRRSKVAEIGVKVATGTVGVITAGSCIFISNKELNTEMYNGTNKQGYKTGQGYAFEDINNRKFRKEGYQVDSSIGKSKKEGGADAIFTDKNGNSFKVQYKCYASAWWAAKDIAKAKGYPEQMLFVNTEVVEGSKVELAKMEAKGEIPKGTADRVVDSGTSREEAIRVSNFGKESLPFDAETAWPTFIMTSLAVGAGTFIYNVIKEGTVNKKVIRNTLLGGLFGGGAAFLGHIGINQYMRK